MQFINVTIIVYQQAYYIFMLGYDAFYVVVPLLYDGLRFLQPIRFNNTSVNK